MSATPGLTTSDTSYYTPLRVKVQILDNFATTTYYTFDSFQPFSSPLNVLQVTVSLAVNQNGTFTIFIEDDKQVIDRTKIGCGNKVIITAGKTSAYYYPILTGYVRSVTVYRDDTGILYYQLGGYGSQIICSERIVDFQKLSSRVAQGVASASTVDQTMLAANLFKTVFEGSSILPLSASMTLQQEGQFTENGIDPRVNNQIGSIVLPLVDAASVLNRIADDSGAIWGIQGDDIFLRYPTAKHSGVTIKNGVGATDLADKTAYITGGYSYSESTDISSGFANRLWLKGGAIANNPSTSSTSTSSFTSLFNKDIAQQIIPTSAQLRSLALTLSLQGTGGAAGTSNQFVTGALIQDRGTGSPSGAKIADFSIPLSSIPATPQSVFDLNFKWYVATLQPLMAYWLVLYAKGTSDTNSVNWYNDGDTSTPNRFSATRQVSLDPTTEARTGFPLKSDTAGWSVSTSGPTYTHDFFENVRVLTEASDPLSMQKYGPQGGPTEVVMDVPWISDNQSLQNYATAILAYTAKPVRQFTLNAVTIPNNFVFVPGMLVDLVDPLGNIAPPKTISIEVQQVSYSFTASGNVSSSTLGQSSAPSGTGSAGRLSHPLGVTTVDLLGLQYYDFLVDSLT